MIIIENWYHNVFWLYKWSLVTEFRGNVTRL
jgi:hypothetical protein